MEFLQWWWWWIVFVEWLTKEKKRKALFPVGTIVTDSQYHRSPACPKQDLNLGRTCWGVVITTRHLLIKVTKVQQNEKRSMGYQSKYQYFANTNYYDITTNSNIYFHCGPQSLKIEVDIVSNTDILLMLLKIIIILIILIIALLLLLLPLMKVVIIIISNVYNDNKNNNNKNEKWL